MSENKIPSWKLTYENIKAMNKNDSTGGTVSPLPSQVTISTGSEALTQYHATNDHICMVDDNTSAGLSHTADIGASATVKQRGSKKATGLPPGEVWVDGMGNIGYATVLNGRIESKTSDEWWHIDKDMADMIDARYEKVHEHYPMAGCPGPYIDHEDKSLLKDIKMMCHRFVDLPPRNGKLTGDDSPYYTAQASWCIASAFAKEVSVRPRWFPRGQTKFGKTRDFVVITLSCYRGCMIGNPTAPLVYRLVSDYDVTLLIDEFQDCDHETKKAVLDVQKLGFDGTSIKRVNMDKGGDIQSFSNKTFSALAIKDSLIPEDVMNRGIPVSMAIKTRKLEQDEPQDNDEFRAIRARLVALKLKVDAGIINLQNAKARAKELSVIPYTFRGKEYTLDGRERNIAEVLLIPVVLMGEDKDEVNDIMEVMVRSIITSEDQNRDMMPCRAWFSLYEEVRYSDAFSKFDEEGFPVFKYDPKIAGSHIRQRLVGHLKEVGDINLESDVKTSKVTGLLESLGFTFDRKHANTPILEFGNTLKVAWRTAILRYGVPALNEDGRDGSRALDPLDNW